MPKPLTTVLGKAVRRIARLKGGGSALPGLFVEKIDSNFVADTLAQLPRGVVLISGTNGKTTTTKMVVELLEGQGLKVFTNKTGSNFIRGVAAALLEAIDIKGKLNADIAVLELDEAHAVHFVRTIQPRYSLLLNVMRDQLDRFGEIDSTAKMLSTIANVTSEGVVLNRDDPRLTSQSFLGTIKTPIFTYGVSTALLSHFPSDDDLRSQKSTKRVPVRHNDSSLEAMANGEATIAYDGKKRKVPLKVNGIYNALNAVGATALCRAILGTALDEAKLFTTLSSVTPAFGRGERLMIDGQPCELVLVKNPAGFRLSLKSFDPNGYKTMIAINDNYADGRDMSWLWDVDFDSLRLGGVAMVAGIRAYDMALRLQYEEVELLHVEPHLNKALQQFLKNSHNQPKRIYCTYTAMLALRRELAKSTVVEKVL